MAPLACVHVAPLARVHVALLPARLALLPAPRRARPAAARVAVHAAGGSAERVSSFEETIPCEGCGGRGWLVCDFCNGEKVNVKNPTRSNKFYRRCPNCRAVGVMLCESCRVFKCLTFADAIEDVQ